MPWLIDDSGDLLFILGIADDESIFLAVPAHPLIECGVFQTFIFQLIVFIGDITGQSGLMLTGSGTADDGRGLFFSVLFHFAVKQILLLLVPPITGRQKNAEPFCSRITHKLLHRLQDPLIQFLSLYLPKFRGIFSDGMICIHKYVFPTVYVDVRKICFFYLPIGNFHLRGFFHSSLQRLLQAFLFVLRGLRHQQHKIERSCQQHQNSNRNTYLPFGTHGSTSFGVSEKIIASLRLLSIENIAERLFFLLY